MASNVLVGLVPAVITVIVAYKFHESNAWKQHQVPSMRGIMPIVWENRKQFAYLVLALTLMVCLSHSTQDLYPDCLTSAHHVPSNTVAYLAMFYNIGALLGTVSFGHMSERRGRRLSIICALSVCALAIPFRAFGNSLTILALGAFFMQIGVQGAWEVIPAHLNELFPDAVRSLFPGLIYQLGVLLGSPSTTIEYVLRDRFGYQWALALFETVTVAALVTVFALGSEQKGKEFFRVPVQSFTGGYPFTQEIAAGVGTKGFTYWAD
jgi:SHS family lactate transporter-like MFS transporter